MVVEEVTYLFRRDLRQRFDVGEVVRQTGSGDGWSEGEPFEDWGSPHFDFFLVFGDERVVRPRVYRQSEVEWDCEEEQRQLVATGGDEI